MKVEFGRREYMNETKDANSENNCTCDTDKKANKNVLVEYLYLDLKTCERCIGTEGILRITSYNVCYTKLLRTGVV